MDKTKPLFGIYVLLSLLFGASVFFTFIVAPAIFSGLDSKNAGFVMNLIFPYYFKLGWIGGILIYTLVGVYSFIDKEAVKSLKFFLVGLFFVVIINMALDRAILPLSKNLLATYYELLEQSDYEQAKIFKERFDTVHKISSVLNLLYIIILVYLLYAFFKFKGVLTKSN